MSIVLARLDNRLLHGIVAAQWTPRSGATRVMVIDDKVADNPVLKDAMKLGKPAGVALSIISRDTAYTNFKAGKYEGQKVFVVCNDPQIILDLIKSGNTIEQIVLGGTVVPQDADEAIACGKRAYIKKNDIAVYKQIMASGSNVVVQFVPADKQEPLSKYIR